MPSNTWRGNTALPYLVAQYDQVLSSETTNEVLSIVCRVLLDRLTPAGWDAAGRSIADSLNSGDFPSLVLFDPDVLDLGADDQYLIRQCVALFSKRRDIDVGVDREAVARDKFLAAEAACRLTNAKFEAWKRGRSPFSPLVESVLHGAQRKISKLLDKAGLLDLSIYDVRPRFGPGATTQVHKKDACAVVKLNRVPSCSANLLPLAPELLSFWGFSGGVDNETLPQVCDGKLSFVPKSAKTDRAICTEPQLNGAFQLGIGDLLADALRLVGIDIRDQGANQRAAMYGSISGALATLDLSSASDTVSIGIVEHLLPEQWFDLLMRFRTASVTGLGDHPVRLAKLSSMGNGFTFPLETMVFWALASSTVDHLRCKRSRVRVYGDDIIVDTEAAEPLMAVLTEVGFTVNPSKSFWTGTFRESCGADFVLGTNVRPVYVGGPLKGADFFRLHNFFVARRDPIAELFEAWIHPSIRCRGPQGYGDGHLHSRAWVSRPAKRNEADGWCGFTFSTWTYSTRLLRRELREQLVERDRHGMITYRRSAWPLVKTLAIYTTYLREQTVDRSDVRALPPNPFAVSAEGSLREFAQCSITSRADRDYLVVPGTGEVKRTKVYIFEPPIMS